MGNSEFTCKDFETVDITSPEGDLVIVEATYGGNDPERDVTKDVQALVNGNRLHVTGGIHTAIGDPEPGVAKTFTVVYKGQTSDSDSDLPDYIRQIIDTEEPHFDPDPGGTGGS